MYRHNYVWKCLNYVWKCLEMFEDIITLGLDLKRIEKRIEKQNCLLAATEPNSKIM